MTKIFLERDGDRFTVSAKEHANATEICAAVSTLLYTLAGYLNNTHCPHDERLEPGDARICFIGEGEAIEAVWDMISIGFLQIQKSYPESVNIVRQVIE